MSADLKPLDLLNVQVDLINWWRSRRGRGFAYGFVRDVTERRGGAASLTHLVAHIPPGTTGTVIPALLEADAIQRAEPFWVSDEMTALIERAAETMPVQTFEYPDLPCPAGIAWVGYPIVGVDVNSRVVSWRLVSWRLARAYRPTLGTGSSIDGLPVRFHDRDRSFTIDIPAEGLHAEDGIALSLYGDLATAPDDEIDDIARGRSLPTRTALIAKLGCRMSLLHEMFVPFGEDWEGALRRIDIDPADPPAVSVIADLRFLAAFWTISKQELAAVRREPLPRAYRRRAALADIRNVADVRIVTLRRRLTRRLTRRDEHDWNPKPGEPAGYSHRFIVSGHWRNQYYPSIGTHRLKWIDAFIKGPESKPLIVKDRVFKVAR